ncbi:hypothetical protein ADUPG1_009612 [Aduncisulcus paluster]|uniref:KHDC4/BBP-like KH-domain type I domain-containing protein n=1 Tax=Aduncisulcus paluster TaxID=2918883 RepID=A0ABQ5KZ04_9EUKA|nr:hypothetical protein ADUPG1_009612 [Aduncisulcus paluster]
MESGKRRFSEKDTDKEKDRRDRAKSIRVEQCEDGFTRVYLDFDKEAYNKGFRFVNAILGPGATFMKWISHKCGVKSFVSGRYSKYVDDQVTNIKISGDSAIKVRKAVKYAQDLVLQVKEDFDDYLKNGPTQPQGSSSSYSRGDSRPSYGVGSRWDHHPGRYGDRYDRGQSRGSYSDRGSGDRMGHQQKRLHSYDRSYDNPVDRMSKAPPPQIKQQSSSMDQYVAVKYAQDLVLQVKEDFDDYLKNGPTQPQGSSSSYSRGDSRTSYGVGSRWDHHPGRYGDRYDRGQSRGSYSDRGSGDRMGHQQKRLHSYDRSYDNPVDRMSKAPPPQIKQQSSSMDQYVGFLDELGD